jgi:hypothetical protein
MTTIRPTTDVRFHPIRHDSCSNLARWVFGCPNETLTVKRFSILALALFVALSVCDFTFTYLLVEGSGGSVYEANPFASSWLADHGWLGLAAFKALAVLVVVGAVGLIVRKRPVLGAAVACAACLATGIVNLHSHKLLAASEAQVGADAERYADLVFAE